MVVELHARDGGLVHADLRHRVRAQDEQLGLDELDDLVADRELAAAVAPDHRELVAPADAQVDVDPLARRVEVLGAVPRRDLVGIGPGLEDPLARGFEDARDQDLLVGGGTGVESLIVSSFPAQVRVEPVHPPLPRPLARLHPLHRLVERLRLHAARPPLRLAAADDQPRALEHLQVARDRGQADRERLAPAR